MKRRILPFLLVLCLTLGLLPVGALGAETVAAGDCGETVTWTLDETGTLTVRGSGNMADYASHGREQAPWMDLREEIRTVVVLPGVTGIGTGAFYRCPNLTKVTLPEGVAYLGWFSFKDCTSLTQVDLPESLKSIRYNAFSGCTSLAWIDLPQGVEKIGEWAFCFAPLKHVTLPAGLTVLEKWVFANVPLESLAIPASVTEIRAALDFYDSQLEWVYYGGSPAQWDRIHMSREVRELLESKTLTFFSMGPFRDVPGEHYAMNPIWWAVDEGVTKGTSATTFSPDAACTKGHILTFLYRAAGAPEVAGPVPFSDVRPTDWYHDAAIWAHKMGLETGETLEPNAPCSRGTAVTYLWKLDGSPDTACTAFDDVPSSLPLARAVSWAVEHGVTTGTTETTFSPDAATTRAQIVTFLHRAEQAGAL